MNETDTPNVDLILDVWATILLDPGHWDQGQWRTPRSCNTSYCFAGHAVHLVGAEMVINDKDYVEMSKRHPHYAQEVANLIWGEGETKLETYVFDITFLPENLQSQAERNVVTIKDTAQEVLGLQEEQAFRLFNGSNNIKDLKRILTEILGKSPNKLLMDRAARKGQWEFTETCSPE